VTRARPAPAPALVVVDVQRGLDHPKYGERNNPGAEAAMASLLAAWRGARWPVIHVQHMSVSPDSPLRPELPGNALKPEVAPLAGEPLFRKSTNSAFVGTGLEAHLRAAGIRELVLVGLTTDHCVSATVRTASDLGFGVSVVRDATATFERAGSDGTHYDARTMHGTALASLEGEFARIVDTGELLARVRADDGG
jgi:nicotinamidase-related amidase